MNPKRLFLLSTCLAALAPATISAQTTYTWNGGGGDNNFSTGLNWGGTAPVAGTSGQLLVFDGSTRLTPVVNTIDTGVTPNGFRAQSITFASGAGAFNISGNDFRMTGTPTITQNSANNQTISQSIGIANIGGITLTIAGSGAGTLSLGGVNFGGSGGNTLALNRSVTIGGLNSSAAGSLVNLADGVTLTLNGTSASGLGTIRMGAGSTTASTTLQAASTSISQMGLEITGSPGSSTTTIAGSNSITLSGSNTFIGTSASTRKLTVTNTGGTTLSGTTLLTNSGGAARTIQFETGSNASLTLSGQVTQTSGVAGTLQKLGTGTLVLSNSANSFSGGLNIDAGTVESQAQGALGAGTVTVGTSGTLRISTADQSLTIGGSGLNLALSGSNSTLDVTAGRKLTLSRSTSGATSFTKTGAGTLELGGANSYSLTSGGSTNVAIVEGSVLMNRSGGSSTFGDATSTPNITIGTAGTVTSATLKAEAATDPFAGKPNLTINHLGTLDLNGRSATATSITMNGGTIQTGAGTISLGTVAGTNLQYTGTTQTATISGFMTLGGVAQTISVANGAAAVDLDITAGINAGGGTGSMLKTGSGTLRLTGNNGYSGGTTVSQGTLLVNNTTGSGTGSGTVDVSSGATLGGTGKINGAVNVTGVLAPGASIESLGSGTLSFSNGSAFNYEINTSTVAADLQFVTGGLNLAGTVTLNLTDLGSLAALTLGTKFTLISYTGTWDGDVFSGYADESTFNFANNQWRINYNDTIGGANFSSDQAGANGFVTMTVIPEPRAALLGGLGLLALLRRRRA